MHTIFYFNIKKENHLKLSQVCSCGFSRRTRPYVDVVILNLPALLLILPYYDQTNEMLRSLSELCNLSLDVLRFGNSSLSVDINTQIFEAVQKFIRDTKRF